MALSPDLLKKLARPYPPDCTVDLRWRGRDLTLKTDGTGHAILLFIGERQPDGTIRGERYARRLQWAGDGSLLKDHWDAKGPSR